MSDDTPQRKAPPAPSGGTHQGLGGKPQGPGGKSTGPGGKQSGTQLGVGPNVHDKTPLPSDRPPAPDAYARTMASMAPEPGAPDPSAPGPSASQVVRKNPGEAMADSFAATQLSGDAPVAPAAGVPDMLGDGDLIGERFKVDRHISSGAFGAVYRASDVGIPNHSVAIKLLHTPAANEAAKEQAMRELRLIASVSHPSVVQFSDYGWHEGRLWFAMPWYEGETLDERIAGIGLTRAEARPIFERIALGLAAMHKKGIGHHDIKPENIFLADVAGFEGGLPVLLDLGIAAGEDEAPMGFTPEYVAPETASRALGDPESQVGPKADVFSLALALRNCLEPDTAPAMTGDSVVPFLHNRATVSITAPFGKQFAYLGSDFARWLNPDPDVRPTAEGFAAELARLTYPEERRAARIRLIKRIAPILLIAGAIVAFLSWQVSQQQDEIVQKEGLISQKEGVISEKEEQLSEKQKALLRQMRQSKKQQQELADKAKDLGLTMAQLDELKTKVEDGEDVQSQLSGMLKREKKETAELSEQNEELSTIKQQLEDNLNLTQAQRDKLEKRQAELKKERDKLEANRDKLREQRNELKAERNELVENLGQTSAERDKLAKAREGLQEDKKTLKKQRDALKESQLKLEAERDELTAQVDKLRGQRDKFKKQRDKLQKELAAAQGKKAKKSKK